MRHNIIFITAVFMLSQTVIGAGELEVTTRDGLRLRSSQYIDRNGTNIMRVLRYGEKVEVLGGPYRDYDEVWYKVITRRAEVGFIRNVFKRTEYTKRVKYPKGVSPSENMAVAEIEDKVKNARKNYL